MASGGDQGVHFARRIGRARPMHLPKLSRPFVQAIVRREHMQQTALAMPAPAPSPRVPGWRARYTDYRSGLEQVTGAWRDEGTAAPASR